MIIQKIHPSILDRIKKVEETGSKELNLSVDWKQQYVSQNSECLLNFPYKILSPLNLRTLNLKNHGIHSLAEIKSPMESIEELNLGYNFLNSLYDISEKFPNLKKLSLEGNPIPDFHIQFITGDKLTHLNLSNIYLESLTSLEESALYNLKNLKYLNLSHNNLDDLDIIKYLESDNLEILDISNNNLKNLKELLRFSSLKQLIIRDDRGCERDFKRQELDIRDISSLVNLEFFCFIGRNLEFFPDFSSLSNLRNVHFKGFVPAQELVKVYEATSLTSLSMEYEHHIYPDIFKGIEKLSNLNSLSAIHFYPKNLKHVALLKNLKRLDITDNSIKDLSPLVLLKNLKCLNLSYNFDLKDCNLFLLAKIPSLEFLNLKHCRLYEEDIRILLKSTKINCKRVFY